MQYHLHPPGPLPQPKGRGLGLSSPFARTCDTTAPTPYGMHHRLIVAEARGQSISMPLIALKLLWFVQTPDHIELSISTPCLGTKDDGVASTLMPD